MASFAGFQRIYDRGGSWAIIAAIYSRVCRAATEAWAISRPRYTMRFGNVPILFKINTDTLELLRCKANWKTLLIRDILALRGGLFLDVGANIGQTLLDYCAATEKNGYLGFEPSVRCADHLRSLISDNRLNECTIVPAGLSDKNNILKLYRNPIRLNDAGATLLADLRPAAHSHIDLVSCYRFDDIRHDLGASARIGLIKIDVEGAELSVIDGMEASVRSDRPWILCEILDRDEHADEDTHKQRCNALLDRIQNLGYDILRVGQTADGNGVEEFTPINQFPDRVWSAASHRECDYLFIPRDQRELVIGLSHRRF